MLHDGSSGLSRNRSTTSSQRAGGEQFPSRQLHLGTLISETGLQAAGLIPGARWTLAASRASCPDYFLAPAAGRSELVTSATTFHVPSACFRNTVTYFPLSVTGFFPFGAEVVIEYVPIV